VLRELSVENLALIEDVRIELFAGYCAWTGETGAGKSLILTALGFVLGGKASSDLIRSGKDQARTSAVFDVSDPLLRADLESTLGGPLEEEQLILTRRISSQGRSTAHANNLPVSISTLRILGERLIDIHGQQESRSLLDSDRQRDLLDAFGAVGPALKAFQRDRETHALLLSRRSALLRGAEIRERERALLTFERDELSHAEPQAGEYEALTREAHRLVNAESVRSASLEGFELLYESDRSAQGQLETVARKLTPLADAVPEFASAAAELSRLADEVREVAYSLRSFARDNDDDPARLEAVEARLASYRALAVRHRCDPDELEDRLEKIATQLAAIETLEQDLNSLDEPIKRAWAEVRQSGSALTAARNKSRKNFGRAVGLELKGLGLSQARFVVEIKSDPLLDDPFLAQAPERGADHVEFVFTPNPGEPSRPLRKIVSGGEMSRVMLALKTALAGVDSVPTLIFDEIDTGVGGRLAAGLGKKLAELARYHQVICVTHLPQVASFADHQWVIRKRTLGGRTRTTITPLGEQERVDEIAAMLRGDSAAEGTRQEALSMLREAREVS
jgi:DNA repair protein RecN (Recombination protein N)